MKSRRKGIDRSASRYSNRPYFSWVAWRFRDQFLANLVANPERIARHITNRACADHYLVTFDGGGDAKGEAADGALFKNFLIGIK